MKSSDRNKKLAEYLYSRTLIVFVIIVAISILAYAWMSNNLEMFIALITSYGVVIASIVSAVIIGKNNLASIRQENNFIREENNINRMIEKRPIFDISINRYNEKKINKEIVGRSFSLMKKDGDTSKREFVIDINTTENGVFDLHALVTIQESKKYIEAPMIKAGNISKNRKFYIFISQNLFAENNNSTFKDLIIFLTYTTIANEKRTEMFRFFSNGNHGQLREWNTTSPTKTYFEKCWEISGNFIFISDAGKDIVYFLHEKIDEKIKNISQLKKVIVDKKAIIIYKKSRV